MVAASIFDHPAVLILIAFIALVRWLISKAKTRVNDPQTPMEAPPPEPITRGGNTQSEEERIRKFLEALGQPRGTVPPPKVTPRPRPATIFPQLPKLKTAPPPLPAQRPAPFVVPPPPPPLPAAAPTRLDTDFQVQDFTRQTSSEPPAERRRSAGSARIKLGTPQDLRTAIILREIFGPPRSLQSFDLTGSI